MTRIIEKRPAIFLIVLVFGALLLSPISQNCALAQSTIRNTGSSYVSPFGGQESLNASGNAEASTSISSTLDQFKSVVDIEKSNPYDKLSSPNSSDSSGQFLGRSNLNPDSLNNSPNNSPNNVTNGSASANGSYGSLYDQRSAVNNPFSQYGRANSAAGSSNPYAVGAGPLLDSRGQRPSFPNYSQLGGGVQRWYP